jgi:hypothetical protein
LQNIHRLHLRIVFLKLSAVTNHNQTLSGSKGKVMLALGANLMIFFEDLIVYHLPATWTLRP